MATYYLTSPSGTIYTVGGVPVYVTISGGSSWILSTNFWVDSSVWNDSAVWQD
jgi:hypothetical protein